MKLIKNNFVSMEKICGKITESTSIENGIYEFVLARVYDWYDEVLRIKGECINKGDYVEFKINNGLEKGLYEILAIKNEKDILVYGDEKKNVHPIGAFTINSSKSINAIDVCKQIHVNRERMFNRPKHLCNNGKGKIFDVYIFCKNIKIGVLAHYDDIEVFPYEYLKITNEIEYINSFFKEKAFIDLVRPEEKYTKEIPSAVFHVSNIVALNYDDAKEYALQKADILNNIFTVLLRSHGTYFAVIILNKTERISQISLLNENYKGNLLLLAENGFNIRQYYNYLNKNNSYLIVYMKLLNDAINEKSRLLKYYRYWNILEGIALLKNFKKKKMKNWNGDLVFNNKNKEILIGEEAVNNVFELLRINFSSNDEKYFINNLENIKNVKEFLQICYQRRNCCAHRGECYSQDKEICDNQRKIMNLCQKNNIIHKEEPSQFQDRILRKLQDVVVDVILKEIIRGVGTIEKEDNIIKNTIE